MKPQPSYADLPAYLRARLDIQSGPHGHWLWTGSYTRANARPKCGIRLGSKQYTLAYQAVLAALYGAPLPGMIVSHLCGNKGCCRPGHVVWATPADNVAFAVRHGERAGTKNGRARLTLAQVQGLRDGTLTAAACGITARHAADIRKGLYWPLEGGK